MAASQRPARPILEVRVRAHVDDTGIEGVTVVARGPADEILARAISGPDGALRLRVSPAALRGLAWPADEPQRLRIELDREAPWQLATPPPEWTLGQPAEVLDLPVKGPEDARSTVLDFPQVRLRPRSSLEVAATLMGLLAAIGADRVELERARGWLLDPAYSPRLASLGLDPTVAEYLDRATRLQRPEQAAALAERVLDYLAHPSQPETGWL